MKIILEGCEGTGKTTLANKFIEKYNLDYVHITNKDPNDYIFYKQTMRKEDVIFDRHLLGEMIYPKVYNRKGNLNFKKLDKLMKFANENDVFIFVLTTDINEIQRRVKERNKYKPDFIVNKLPIINKQFCDLAIRYVKYKNVILVDTTKIQFEALCNYMEDYHEPHL